MVVVLKYPSPATNHATAVIISRVIIRIEISIPETVRERDSPSTLESDGS